MNLSDVPNIVEGIAAAHKDFREKHSKELAVLKDDNARLLDRIEAVEAARSSPGRTGPNNTHGDPPAYELIDKEGKRYPALTKAQRLTDYARTLATEGENQDFSLGEHVRGIMLGRKVSSGPALVPQRVGAEIIDAVRAQLALIR